MTRREKTRVEHGSRAEKPAGVEDLYGFMRGSVIIPPHFDLTKPVLDEPFLAENGEIYSQD